MIRLPFCALATFVITSSAALAVGQDGQPTPATGAFGTEQIAEISPKGNTENPATGLTLGVAKASAPCQTACISHRLTDPRFATVGERDVATHMAKIAVPASQLHVDRSRTAALYIGKIPRGALVPQALIVPTRNAFRPALDPVLAAPGTTSDE